MQSVAVGWQVYSITHRPLDLGYVGLAQFVPAVVLSLATGAVADRFDRRRIVVLCQCAYAATAAMLFLYARAGATRVEPIYAALVFFGVARAFAGPAAQSLLPMLVPAEDLTNAITWSTSIWEIASIAGPAVGGLVYGAAGSPTAVYAVSAGMALGAAALTATLRPRAIQLERREVTPETLFAGLRYVWREKLILGAISLDLFAVLFGGAVALLPAIAHDVLHTGPRGLGLLRSAPALGALAVSLWLAHHPLRRRVGRTMFACVGVFGVATIVFGLSHSFVLSLVALVAIGASDMVSVVVRLVLVQTNTPEAMRGRVSAVNLVFVGASNELGEFESGLTAAWLGLVPAVILGGVGTLAVVAVCALLFPALRQVDRLDRVPG